MSKQLKCLLDEEEIGRCILEGLDREITRMIAIEGAAVTESPPVQGTRDETTGSCVFTITEWEARFNNVPKNELAVNSPVNDYFVERYTVNYSWPGAAVVVPPQRDLPSPGTVAPGAEQSIKFEPILLQDFDPAMEGTTGILDMVVRARYADGTRVTIGLQESLVVNACQ